MVWLDICDEQGNTFYFDVHHVERKRVARRWRHAVSGICGNGLLEMSVLVELGGQGEVTYVDFIPESDSDRQLLSGLHVEMLDEELLAIARQQCGLDEPVLHRNPHTGRSALHCACEEGPVWQGSV